MAVTSPASGLEEADREQIRLRAIIIGATGSGKTATALIIANALRLRYGGRIGVIDTMHRQSLNYVKTRYAPDGFVVKHLDSGHPDAFVNAIKMFRTHGNITALVIDGISPAWAEEGGVVDQAGPNATISDWGQPKRSNMNFLREVQRSPFHVICTCLTNTEYFMRPVEKANGKTGIEVNIVGTKPIQDKDAMPKFDLQCGMDQYHNLTVYRSSFDPFDRMVITKPDEKWFEPYMDWMEKGELPPVPLDEADVPSVSYIATSEQVEEYYKLGALFGYGRKETMLSFYKKYGSKPEETASDFLETKLVELRAKKPPIKRPTEPVTTPPQAG